MNKKSLNPPQAQKRPKSLKIHDHERIDDYFWMRDREDQEVIEHLKAENAYTKKVLLSTEKAQEHLFEEMKARIKEDDSSVPYLKNGYWYYYRYEKGKEYPILCRKKESLDAEEVILIDENKEAKKHPYYNLVSFSVTLDNKILAIAEDITGRRLYRIRFKNLETEEFFDHHIDNTSSDLAWHNDGEHLYYCQRDADTLRPYLIRSFNYLTGKSADVFEEEDEAYIASVEINKDFKHILISSHSTLTTEFRIKKANDHHPFEVFLPREEGHEYYVEMDKEKAVIRTNKNAENFCLKECMLHDSAFEKWKVIQPHDEQVLLEDFEVFTNYYVTQEKEMGLSRFRVFDIKNNTSKVVKQDEETYTLYIGTNPELDQDNFRVGYSSMTTPNSILGIDFKTFEKTLLKQREVQGEFNAENYRSERIWANARDGEKVAVSLVYRKDQFERNGKNPLLIYAYGSYGSTVDPYFSSVRLSLLDRGFVFALAHIRGGEYLGRQWYENGKLLHKKNTFNDFIDCTEHLIQQQYANKDQVYAMGGSAGGLLMGVISNDRPELYAGIVSQVPFVDVMSTMLDDSIPLTTGEYDEWGNPNEKTYYDYMLSYSPYDNIKAQNYPPMLVTSGLHDSQVQYWEPTKYVAKIREYKTNQAVTLLYTNMEAGHGGASGRFEALKEVALEYAFLLWLSGHKMEDFS